MSRRTRTLFAILSAVLVGAVGTAVVAPPASATVTRLCYGYTSCANAGYSSAGYSTANRTMYWQMYSGHNCTNYAAYRMVKSGMPNSRPWVGSGNATNWGVAMARITDSTPRVGSIAWWRAGVYPAGSAGHVAYVEKVISSSEIIVSQDSWGGDFSWARVTKDSKGWPSGFIHFNDLTMVNSQRPTVSGAARIGSLLTATPGLWAPGGATLSYQWKAGKKSIPGATSSTFRLTEDQVGKRVRVRVDATKPGYTSSHARSEPTDPVQSGRLANDSAPTIHGEPTVDATLTADAGSWTPNAQSADYQWLADGKPVSGGDQKTLALTPSMVGQRISVRVTAHRESYADTSATSDATAPVSPGSLTVTAEPTLDGSPHPGEVLTADVGSATPHATPKVRWLRDGQRIDSASGTTYELTKADVGTRVQARVVWKRPGYTRLRALSVDAPLVRSVPDVSISLDSPRAGRLTVSVTTSGSDDTQMRVKSHGRLLTVAPVSDGAGRAKVSGLSAGRRYVKVIVGATDTTTRVVVRKQVRVA